MNTSADETLSPRSDVLMMLGLCPLLAASDTLVNALGIAIAVVLVTAFAGVVLLALARWTDDSLRIAAALLVFALAVALVERTLLAWFYPLRNALSLFLPLIAVNAALLRTWQATQPAALDALRGSLVVSARIAFVLVLLGSARELVGHGSLFDAAAAAFGSAFTSLETTVFRVDMGFLLAMLPPGAFIALGLLFALYNWTFRRRARPSAHASQ